MGAADHVARHARGLPTDRVGPRSRRRRRLLYHSVAAALELMWQLGSGGAAHFVRQNFALRDFTQGKGHIVAKLRQRVAVRVANGFTPEDLLNFVITGTQQHRAGAWLDQWRPAALLDQCGFGYLRTAENVNAIGANEHGGPEDAVVSFQGPEGMSHHVHANGTTCLQHLREELRGVLEMCGNVHWATATDITALAESLNLGFIVFSDVPQGAGSHVYGLNQRRADYEWWVLLYCRGNLHYQLAALAQGAEGTGQSFFHVSQLPVAVRAAFDSANPNCPIGRAYAGGIA